MKKILGFITEFNPFHNGHKYLIDMAKSKIAYPSEEIVTIAVMSGNFVQRGIPSIINKWEKTKIAIQNGIDLVIELPTVYAISSSENFAHGSIKLLNSLNVSDIFFGSESENLDYMNEISDVLIHEPAQYKKYLCDELHKGLSFPKSRENALSKYLGKELSILHSPNDILGIEYLKFLKAENSSIIPHIIKRNDSFISSSQIRTMLYQGEDISSFVPKESLEIIQNNELITLKHFEKEIIYSLRKMDVSEIANAPDVSEGLEYKIKKSSDKNSKIENLIEDIKSKRYTTTRIQRILLYILLNIHKEDIELSKKTLPYAHILGFNTKGEKYLSSLSECKKAFISTNSFLKNCNDEKIKKMLNIDILASNIYNLSYTENHPSNEDYTHMPIIFRT